MSTPTYLDMTTSTNFSEELALRGQLDTLLEFLPRLRKEGVTRFQFGGMAVDMVPPEPELPDGFQNIEDVEDEVFQDPLLDPSSYAGGKVPGFSKLRERRKGELDE